MGGSSENNLSRRLGDRGDLVACLTSELGMAVERGRGISPDRIEELEETIDEIQDLVESIEDVGVVCARESDRAEAD